VKEVSACAQQSSAASPLIQRVKAAVCTLEWILATAGPELKLLI